MRFLIGLAIFPVVASITVTLCTKKGWPLVWGLVLAIFLQPIGHALAFLAAVYLAWHLGPALAAFFYVIVVPVVGGILPVVVAALMPHRHRVE
jgi:hypothetical protein